MTTKLKKTLKKDSLRYNEYYNMQKIFDNLYEQSLNQSEFKNLYSLIIKKENIMLAYRNIKRNGGSKTPGVNGHKIKHFEEMEADTYINYVRARLQDFQPLKVKRVEIPKPNGKKRPLGIPCIEDRIIQQAIKQVLEPICEAKFYKHSYGFRPNRSTENAVAYMYKKINIDKCYYCVDIDIKGFFDNVNHQRLIEQIWAMGIHDKKLISILKSMLKAEIDGVGIPTCGIPQGGILSPLLANIVLNTMDQWITSQWEAIPTKRTYTSDGNKYKSLRNLTNLKEMYLVRYADDFKIFCKDYQTANKAKHAVTQWLQENLKLEISEEKSGITNLTEKPTEFLGFTIKAHLKGKKWVVTSHMCDKAIKKTEEDLRKQVKKLQKKCNAKQVILLNAMIAGKQNYYRIATEVNSDFGNINYNLLKCMRNRFKDISTKTGRIPREYNDRYRGYNGKILYILGLAVYPIYAIKTKYPLLFTQEKCDYTESGRELIHQKIGFVNKKVEDYLIQHMNKENNVEFNDNILSKYRGQRGKCAITGLPLDITLEAHHIIPTYMGGTDGYKNIVLILYEMHKLIHCTKPETIKEYLGTCNLTVDQLEKLNKFRLKVGNEVIEIN